MAIVRYEHHGINVAVQEQLKGKHREYCLCYSCTNFDEDAEKNCPRSNLLYTIAVLLGMVFPVWECDIYEEI